MSARRTIAAVLAAGLVAFPALVSNASVPVVGPGASDTLSITDDRQTAMFAAPSLAPGDIVSECITVSVDSRTAARLAIFIRPGDLAGTGLGEYLHVTVTTHPPGEHDVGTRVYDGTLAEFAERHTSFASGVGLSSPLRDGALSYHFEVTLLDDPRAEGLDATVAFTWEATDAG